MRGIAGSVLRPSGPWQCPHTEFARVCAACLLAELASDCAEANPASTTAKRYRAINPLIWALSNDFMRPSAVIYMAPPATLHVATKPTRKMEISCSTPGHLH